MRTADLERQCMPRRSGQRLSVQYPCLQKEKQNSIWNLVKRGRFAVTGFDVERSTGQCAYQLTANLAMARQMHMI